MPDHQCTFCSRRHIFKARMFHESDYWWAALDGNPVSPGNSIVVSRTHVESILSAGAPALAELGSVIQKVSLALKDTIKPDDLDLYSRFGFQNMKGKVCNVFVAALAESHDTRHLHFHVIPYFSGQRAARAGIDGKMFSWLGQQELLRDGGRERAALVSEAATFWDKVSEKLRLPELAKRLENHISTANPTTARPTRPGGAVNLVGKSEATRRARVGRARARPGPHRGRSWRGPAKQ